MCDSSCPLIGVLAYILGAFWNDYLQNKLKLNSFFDSYTTEYILLSWIACLPMLIIYFIGILVFIFYKFPKLKIKLNIPNKPTFKKKH